MILDIFLHTFLKCFLILTLNSHAAEPTKALPTKKIVDKKADESAKPLPLNEEKFAAIVQYTSGSPKTEGDKTLEFKDFVRFGEKISVPKGSRLKLITQKRCIAVFYDETQVEAPADKGSPWEVTSGSLRWICPEDKIERILYQGSELQVQNGEFLFYSGNLVPFRTNILFQSHPLQLNSVYTFQDNEWQLAKEQPEPYDLYSKDRSYAIPVESSRNTATKPDNPKTFRFSITPLFGIGGVQNYASGSARSDMKMEANGGRIGVNFPLKNKSILAFFEFSENSNSDHKKNYNGPTPVGFKGIHTEKFTIAFGRRHDHLKSGSTYYYGGLSHLKYDFNVSQSTFQQTGAKLTYPALTAGFGYQKIFFPKSWFGFIIGAEAQLSQTVGKGSVSNNNSWNNKSDPRTYLTEYKLQVYLGPVLQF